MKTFNHYSVMLEETIEYLDIKPDGIYVDATLGGGGHSLEIAKKLENGKLFCFDQDDLAINNAKEKFIEYDNVTVIKSNFVNLKKELLKHGEEKIDGIIFDLGVSSMQLDESERGFSYMTEGPLDMRMDQSNDITAKFIVNTYSKEKLVEIFQKYGEEKLAKLYATKIVQQREEKEFETTKELSDLILNVIPKKDFYKKKSHPAIKVFQAIRIEVNKELIVFERVLPEAFEMLNSGGRICVITFHSLEDKICKYYFKNFSKVNPDVEKLPIIPEELQPKGKLVFNKPLLPTKDELEKNSRSKSAKLRVIEKR